MMYAYIYIYYYIYILCTSHNYLYTRYIKSSLCPTWALHPFPVPRCQVMRHVLVLTPQEQTPRGLAFGFVFCFVALNPKSLKQKEQTYKTCTLF